MQQLAIFQNNSCAVNYLGIVRNDLVVNRFVGFFGKSGGSFYYACGFLKPCDWRLSSFPFNSLISSYADIVRPQRAILGYRQIVRNGFLPDMYTLPAVLKSFSKFMGIGVVRAGLLDEALLLVKTMPMSPDVLIVGVLLSASKAIRILQISQSILDHIIELESRDSRVYVLLSNIYATKQRWTDVTRVRRLMNYKGIKKVAGMSI
ncbi:hypothetical protein GH714_040229 [Hevea brasiliensis]|uniref:Pentatricopeptide repeat-containing protein n=1 Tax=Hevea brasiliensis TaxID=3981 RepID=A0A6A6MPX5_HEVBR|nr:hypothetical protein GH714_040229 [Hevea brasiliensis]